MNSKLDKKLVKKYPKIFAQRHTSMKKTAMCWGFECGDGWYDLIDSLCSLIQNHCDSKQSRNKEFQVEATQVKEKYGGLRFYTSYEDDYICGAISLAEDLSYKICEECGSTDKVAQTKGWIVTLCKKCMKRRKK